MSDDTPPEPADTNALEALDRVLEEFRREFAANPDFAHRVVRALGATVSFDPKHAASLINPVDLVARSPEEASATLSGLAPAELKKIARDSKLATGSDLTGKSKDELVALIVRRAGLRIQSRSSGA